MGLGKNEQKCTKLWIVKLQTWNIRETEREGAYLSCVSQKYQKSYQGLLILIIVSNKLDDHS